MSPEKPQDNADNAIEKVYLEASQWVRLANQIVWTMGTILIPVSFSFIGFALNRVPSAKFEQTGRIFLAIGSVLLFSFWVYTSFLYRRSSTIARQVLIRIEKEWGIPEDMSLYYRHGMIGLKWYSLYNLQVIALVLLITAWGVILIFKPGLY